MQLSPEAIDALVMNLKQAMTLADHLPESVKTTGTAFLGALDQWSDKLRKEQAAKTA